MNPDLKQILKQLGINNVCDIACIVFKDDYAELNSINGNVTNVSKGVADFLYENFHIAVKQKL